MNKHEQEAEARRKDVRKMLSSLKMDTDEELIESVNELKHWAKQQSGADVDTPHILALILTEKVIAKKIKTIDELWKRGYSVAIMLGVDWDYVMNFAIDNAKREKVDIKYVYSGNTQDCKSDVNTQEQIIELLSDLKSEIQSVKKRQDIFFEKQMAIENDIKEMQTYVKSRLSYAVLSGTVTSGVQEAFGNTKALPYFIEGASAILNGLDDRFSAIDSIEKTTKQILNLQY